jgi:anti-anti-sigma regulatory factor
LLTRVGYPCDVPCGSSGITRRPQNEKKEKKKGKNMSATDTVLVSCANRIVWVRVQGKGSSANSTALRDFAKEMIRLGAREFIVDLRYCPAMDSTFMGTLAGISFRLRETGEGSLSVVNPNERNAESLCSLGLEQLFNVRVSPIKMGGQALTIPLKEDRTTRAQTMLEAHEALIKTAPENLPKFKDVIQYLEEKLHVSK